MHDRALIGIDRDWEAVAAARERLPSALIVDADLLDWVPPSIFDRSAGLVIAGGDLLPLLLHEEELHRLMNLAARILAPEGIFAIDATRIDPTLLRATTARAAWGEDVRWRSAEGTLVVRESRLFPEPSGRSRAALLQIRHTRPGPGGSVDERAPFPIRAWEPDEIEEAAKSTGLHVIQHLEEDRIRWLLRSIHA